MKLMVIIFCLAIERYLGLGDKLHRFNWFDQYVTLLKKSLGQENLWQGWLALAVVLAPAALAVLIVYHLLGGVLLDVIGMLLAVVILLYCLGPDGFYDVLEQYFAAEKAGNNEAVQSSQHRLLGDTVPGDAAERDRAITRSIFTNVNSHIFGVIFWFALLGPVGAVLYRVTGLIVQASSKADNTLAKAHDQAVVLQGLLDWLPVRVISLTYALAGNFNTVFGCWLRMLLKSPAQNEGILVDCGLVALGKKAGIVKTADIEENKAALGLLDRSLIVVIILMAIFTLGAWIY